MAAVPQSQDKKGPVRASALCKGQFDDDRADGPRPQERQCWPAAVSFRRQQFAVTVPAMFC